MSGNPDRPPPYLAAKTITSVVAKPLVLLIGEMSTQEIFARALLFVKTFALLQTPPQPNFRERHPEKFLLYPRLVNRGWLLLKFRFKYITLYVKYEAAFTLHLRLI